MPRVDAAAVAEAVMVAAMAAVMVAVMVAALATTPAAVAEVVAALAKSAVLPVRAGALAATQHPRLPPTLWNAMQARNASPKCSRVQG